MGYKRTGRPEGREHMSKSKEQETEREEDKEGVPRRGSVHGGEPPSHQGGAAELKEVALGLHVLLVRLEELAPELYHLPHQLAVPYACARSCAHLALGLLPEQHTVDTSNGVFACPYGLLDFLTCVQGLKGGERKGR